MAFLDTLYWYNREMARLQQTEDVGAIRRHLEQRQKELARERAASTNEALQTELHEIKYLLAFLAMTPEQQAAARAEAEEAKSQKKLARQRFEEELAANQARERALQKWIQHEVSRRSPLRRTENKSSDQSCDALTNLAAAVEASTSQPRRNRGSRVRKKNTTPGEWQTGFVFIFIGSIVASILLLVILEACGIYGKPDNATITALVFCHGAVIPFVIAAAWAFNRTAKLPTRRTTTPSIPPVIINRSGLSWDPLEMQQSMGRAQRHLYDLGNWLAENFTPQEHVQLDIARLRDTWELVSRGDWDPTLNGPPIRHLSSDDLAPFSEGAGERSIE